MLLADTFLRFLFAGKMVTYLLTPEDHWEHNVFRFYSVIRYKFCEGLPTKTDLLRSHQFLKLISQAPNTIQVQYKLLRRKSSLVAASREPWHCNLSSATLSKFLAVCTHYTASGTAAAPSQPDWPFPKEKNSEQTPPSPFRKEPATAIFTWFPSTAYLFTDGFPNQSRKNLREILWLT
jgi:hypothetical protein